MAAFYLIKLKEFKKFLKFVSKSAKSALLLNLFLSFGLFAFWRIQQISSEIRNFLHSLDEKLPAQQAKTANVINDNKQKAKTNFS